jgi:hypothetical protein
LRKISPSIAAVALLGIATGCTSGNSGLQPGYTSANLSSDKLQAAVGVATFNDGTIGLNVVASWRQPNGDSATGLSTPSITGPSTFVVPASAEAGDDAGTNVISGSLQVLPGQSAKPSTLSTNNGIFSYGIQPDNSQNTGSLISSFNTLPFYAADEDPNCTLPSPPGPCPQDQFIGGPPAYPNFRNGNYPAAFNGYSEGFTTFYATPVGGTYGVNLTIQTSNAGTYVSPTASATLTSTKGLPAWTTTPVLTPDGSGGAKITFKPPAGVTETIVNVQDETSGGVFTAVAAAGVTSVAIPGNIGPGNPPTTTFASGSSPDMLLVQLIGVDYPAFEAAPPINTSQLPVLTGPAGQTDITFGDYSGPYGGALSPSSRYKQKLQHYRRIRR